MYLLFLFAPQFHGSPREQTASGKGEKALLYSAHADTLTRLLSTPNSLRNNILSVAYQKQRIRYGFWSRICDGKMLVLTRARRYRSWVHGFEIKITARNLTRAAEWSSQIGETFLNVKGKWKCASYRDVGRTKKSIRGRWIRLTSNLYTRVCNKRSARFYCTRSLRKYALTRLVTYR